MNPLKKFSFILILLCLSMNVLKADDKVSYIDIDYILTNTLAGKELLSTLKKEEEIKINKYKSNDDSFKNEEKQILAKKNLISEKEINNEMKALQIKFQKYKKVKQKEVEDFKIKRNRNILNFLNLINPVIEKYMTDNSIYMIIDKKNVFIASKNYDITKNLIELIDDQIKTIEIK